jgi:hypothetical protein
LAITEGRFGKPVKGSGRFFNSNYLPQDVSQEELERYWGDPEDIMPLRDMNIKPLKKTLNNKFEPSFL